MFTKYLAIPLLAGGLITSAHAVIISVPTLDPPTITLMAPNYAVVTASTPGTWDFINSVNGTTTGTSSANVTLGNDPSLAVFATNNGEFIGPGGTNAAGQIIATLQYSMEFYAPGTAYGTQVPVLVTVSGSVTGTPNQAGAEAKLELYQVPFGPNQSYGISSGIYSGQTNGSQPLAPFMFQMLVNQIYNVTLTAAADATAGTYPTVTSAVASAIVDPTFQTTSTLGQFVFSPGVTTPVPLPKSWSMLIGGLGILGLAARRRKPRRVRIAHLDGC